MSRSLDALVVGGGMITTEVILPSLYHLQRLGMIGSLSVCATRSSTLRMLAGHPVLAEAFPGQGFAGWPDPSAAEQAAQPLLYRAAIRNLAPRQLVVAAVPDQLHHEVVMAALEAMQHVLCVKPLALSRAQAAEIRAAARERGLFVGVEYHKRFDRRSLVARAGYRAGRFGEFVMGEAKLIEPYRYRRSNFQTWFVAESTDPFTYIGCHYVDLVHFITGLLPEEVSVVGLRRSFPSGREGFLWSHARVFWENGALLSVINGLGYPDEAAGSNDQGLTMYCEGPQGSGMIRHDDHYRGVSHAYVGSFHEQGSHFRYTSPDFFQLVPWEGAGLRPIGYGYDSVEAAVKAALGIEEAARGLPAEDALAARRGRAERVDEEGLIATPANSVVDDLVVEAGRLSILADGAPVRITHGQAPRVEPARESRQNGGK